MVRIGLPATALYASIIVRFYLPVWFQGIQGKSPQSAGLSLLSLLLSQVVFVILGGIMTSVRGYYTPLLILGGAISIVGSALITTWEIDTEAAKWIGYQVSIRPGRNRSADANGIDGSSRESGSVSLLQQPNIAAQTVLSKADAPIGLSVLTFLQFLGGSIFVAVRQTLLEAKLVEGLDGKVNLHASAIANGGATSLRTQVPDDKLNFVLQVYNDSLSSIWYLALALSCLVFVASFGFEWKSVKENKENGSNVEI